MSSSESQELTHLGAHMVSIIQIGRDGSSIAMPMLAKVIAPINR